MDGTGSGTAGARSGTPSARRPLAPHTVLLAVAVLTGAALRLRAFAADRSLWYDEAIHALRVLGGPLDGIPDPPTSPLGFVAVARMAVAILGPGELALRAWPLVCSLAALPLFARVARRLLDPWAAVAATAMFALAVWPVYFAGEFKANAADVLFALLLVELARPEALRPPSPRRAVAFGMAAAVAVWLSHPAGFVVAGATVACALPAVVRREWRAAAPVTAAALVAAASFAVHHALGVGDLVAHPFLVAQWGAAFAPLPPLSADDLAWYARTAETLAWNPGGFRVPRAAVAAALAGAVALAVRRETRGSLAALGAPMAVLLLASAAHAYPIRGRTVLFLLPAVTMLVAAGATWPLRALAGRPATARLAAALLPVAFVADAARGGAFTSLEREEVRPLLARLAREARPGDVLYVYYGAIPALRYERIVRGLPDLRVVEGVRARGDEAAYAADLARIEGSPRVWLLASHVGTAETDAESRHLQRLLTARGRPLGGAAAPGAWLRLFDLSRDDRAEVPGAGG